MTSAAPRPDESDPRRWYSTNLVGVPTGVLASPEYNRHAQPLAITGTRETHPGLFALLAGCADAPAAADVFEHYMEVAFGLGRPDPDAAPAERRRHRSSYLKLLQGWGIESNDPPGAVLKGWVESRFGLVPTFHKAALGRFPSPAWVAYLEEKAGSRFHNNCINLQIDLLYEYCQWTLARFAPLGPSPVRLWRGSNRCEEQVVSGALRARRCVMRMNNLVSFSLTRERAETFGDWILEADVPAPKILFYPGLLRGRVLNGEGEVIAIGGDYDVRTAYL